MAENQHRRGHTWGVKALVLICASVITVGSYYVYDTPSSLYGQLQEHFMFENDEISASTFDLYFNLLYSVYSIPNILLPFLGGHLVDTVGMRVCIVGFSSLVLLGQLLTALGCTVNSMATMLLGRLIFGLGGECVVVGQSAFVSAWFKGGEVAFALGFILSLSRIGSVANDWLSPVIAEMYGVNAAFWVGAFLCLISTGTAFLLACIDDNATRNRKRSASSSIASEADGHKYLKGSYFETPLPSGAATPHQRMASVDEDRSLGRLEGAELQAHLYQRLEHQRQHGSGLEDEELWHLLGFNSMFWLLAVVCLLCYGAVMPFNNIANVFLLTYYIPIKAEAPDGVDCNFKPILPEWRDYCTEVDRARRKAGTLQSIPFIIAAVLTPLLGIVIDVYGRRTLWILLGPLLLFFTHLLLFTEKTVAEVPLAGLGLAYSIVAAVIWPSVPLTVEEDVSSKKCGTAFGILTVFQNLSMAVFPIALAALYELSHNYMLGEIFFMAISLVGILTALVLFIVDERTGAVLRLRSIKNMGASPRHHANYDNASRSPLPSNTILSTPPVRIQARMAVQTPPTTSPQPSSSSERNYLRPPDAVKYGTQQTPTGKR